MVTAVTDPDDVDEDERAARQADGDGSPGELPLEAEPADALEQSLEVPTDDDEYRE